MGKIKQRVQSLTKREKFLVIGFTLSTVVALISILLSWDSIWTSFLIGLMAISGTAFFATNPTKTLPASPTKTLPANPTSLVVNKAKDLIDSHKIIRTNQSIELTFKMNKSKTGVIVEGVHRYKYKNLFPDKDSSVEIRLSSGLGRGEGKAGGFTYAQIGGRNFNERAIAHSTHYNKEMSSETLILSVPMPTNGEADCEFHSYGEYRLNDSLIWTVQDLSDNLELTVKNETGYSGYPNTAFRYRIFHHKSPMLENGLVERRPTNVDVIDFDDCILPYQGFEISWSLENA
jgi:hypothetical protein